MNDIKDVSDLNFSPDFYKKLRDQYVFSKPDLLALKEQLSKLCQGYNESGCDCSTREELALALQRIKENELARCRLQAQHETLYNRYKTEFDEVWKAQGLKSPFVLSPSSRT